MDGKETRPSPPQQVAPTEPSPTEPSPPQQVVPRGRWLPVWLGIEAVVSMAAAFTLTALCVSIDVDPLDRVGQVSGVAAVQFRFAALAVLLVAGLLAAHRWWPASRPYLTRIGCAAAAGLVSGAVAGGLVVALRGAQHGLWAAGGDFVAIREWIRNTRDGKPAGDHYPPLFMYVWAGWAWLRDTTLTFSLKDLQIAGTALFGPAAYLSWRLVLRPGWALAIGVVATLPIYDLVKPYREGILMVLVPVLIALTRRLRSAAELSTRAIVVSGLAFGAGLGLLFMTYSGWFVWLAPGMLAAFAVLTPWRSGLRQAALLLGVTGAVFVGVTWIHLRGLLAASGAVSDNYFYFDTEQEPAYIAMWRNDRPGPVQFAPWPPPGELGGVGLFTLLLVAGLGLALWFGWRRTAVVTVVCGIAGAWLLRMYLAGQMYESQLVRLYPRTSMVLLYLLLIALGLGVMYAASALRTTLRTNLPTALPTAGVPVALMLIPVLFLFASMSSATVDRHMPDERIGYLGFFAWIAHKELDENGQCSVYAMRHGGCGLSG